MTRVAFSALLLARCGSAYGRAVPPPASTVFEGARVIVGDGRVIENAAIVVSGQRIVQVGRAADVDRADWRGAREPGRQDGDAGDRRHARAPESDARGAGRRSPASRLLGRRRRHEPRAGHGRAVADAQRDRSRAPPCSVPPDAESRRRSRAAPRCRTGFAPRPRRATAVARAGGAPASTSSRSGWTIATACTRSCRRSCTRAVIDEAHKRNLRVTAHIFSLDDAKGLLRAGIDAFAHGVRDRDLDDEGVALFRRTRTSSSCRTFPIAGSRPT